MGDRNQIKQIKSGSSSSSGHRSGTSPGGSSGHSPGGHSGHHRRNGRSLKHRIKRFLRKNHMQIVLSCIIVVAVCVIMGGILYRNYQKTHRSIRSENSYDMASGYRNITYEGKRYQYNSLITTVLYAGIDSFGKIEETGFLNGPRADTVSLVVLDKKHKKMTIMAFNRDTMTEIREYSVAGRDRGRFINHLGYAYTYGDGGKISCENLKLAVSDMLGGIPIDEYVITNQTSMPYINNLAGGVTVTVPNDDLVEKYPELYKGAVVKLDDSNISDYLHYRDTTIYFSNEGRIERQQAYVSAYITQAKQQARENPEGTWNKLEDMSDYLQTSITKNKYLNLLNLLSQVDFTESDYYRPEGEDVPGENHDEFYLDEDSLRKKVVELFYEEI